MPLSRRLFPLVLLAWLFTAAPIAGQYIRDVSWELVQEVMPTADRFDDVSGDPPVVAAYSIAEDGAETLLGYVFHTADLPPEHFGYSGTIRAVVGMTVDGTLTGVRVTDYYESYMRQMGDFLRRRGFQEQFGGKYIGDPFRVWGDIDGISRVSISVRALARGVRDSARRVAMAYSAAGGVALPTEPVTDIYGMSWFELRRLGVVERFEVTEPGQGSAGISLAYLGSDRAGEYFFGRLLYERALRSMERRGGADHLVLYAVDGSRLRLFLREGWSIAQDGDTTAIDPTDVVMLGLPSGGVVSGEATMIGVMLIKRTLDIRRPFTFIYDLGDLGVHTVEYTTQDARAVMAEATAAGNAEEPRGAVVETSAAAPVPDSSPGHPATEVAVPPTDASVSGAGTATDDEIPTGVPEEDSSAARVVAEAASPDPTTPPEGEAAPAEPRPPAAASEAVDSAPSQPGAADPALEAFQELDLAVADDESILERTLADTSWSRVAIMLLVLMLAAWAFHAKREPIRWVSLVATLVLLGFVDGGFLSVSHITSGIWAGMGVYLRDLPLLLIVVFTLVTTLVWGRILCGFLCPFGALQDVIDRLVPKRFQRALPQRVHDRALWVKYAILALIVLPALAGSHVSLYQYFEPFGTVFFISTSFFFWSIAGAFLIASAVVPRFYCRYACPLGAALALLSLLAPRRIARVEQCDLCKVCEQRCPTGAIRGPDIDFAECVRCNVCEIQLIEKRGVCRHSMEEIRPRLVQVETRRTAGAVHGG
jgi:ferredoxin/Na+-translocating ferredoxin:NAD+ oxidoreductase RnfG subunit